ncbi:MAG: HD domain-containing protein [Fibrobacterota bacterium]
MKYLKAKLISELCSFFGDDFRRIDHALRVFDESIKILSSYPEEKSDKEILTAAALLHDTGIKPSEKKYGYNNGHTQEELGPDEAEKILRKLDFPKEKIKTVRDIIGNHHSPSKHPYTELEILKKADRKINLLEKEKGAS